MIKTLFNFVGLHLVHINFTEWVSPKNDEQLTSLLIDCKKAAQRYTYNIFSIPIPITKCSVPPLYHSCFAKII